MYPHDFIKLLLRYLLANFTHRSYDIQLCYTPAPIAIKCREEGYQKLIRQLFFHINSCHQEFGEIDFAIARKIYFVNNVLNLIVLKTDFERLKSLFQL